MIPVYLCEDDPGQLSNWIRLIENTALINEWDMQIKAAATTPEALLQSINRKEPETAVYFLDVDLKSSINGIELAVEIRKFDPRAFIIFVTTHGEMAIYTLRYRVEPLGYVLKGRPDFAKQMMDCLQSAYDKYIAPGVPAYDKVAIRTGEKVLMLPMDDIYYIRPSTHSRRLILHKEHEVLEFSSSLKEISRKLDSRFVQCHKACIVNCHHILRIEKRSFSVLLDNGSACPCSVRQLNALCRKLTEG